MRTSFFFKASLLYVAVAASTTAFAQSSGTYDLKWSTIDGGGRTSTGGVYSVSGTIGQPDAGTIRGGSFSLTGGFWSPLSVVQTNAPHLRITPTSTSGAVVSWPAPSTGWVLQQTTALATPPGLTVWTDVTSPPVVVVGGENTVTLNPATGARYFRLRQL